MNALLVALVCCFQGDPSRIEWVTPGHFKKALKRSADDQRLILIKGIAFGVDAEGAACATKGEW